EVLVEDAGVEEDVADEVDVLHVRVRAGHREQLGPEPEHVEADVSLEGEGLGPLVLAVETMAGRRLAHALVISEAAVDLAPASAGAEEGSIAAGVVQETMDELVAVGRRSVIVQPDRGTSRVSRAHVEPVSDLEAPE